MKPGDSLGPYRVVSALGEGGMGEVYRARDTKLNRDVAIKILPDAVANDADRVARFTREAQALAALNHPNIAQIYGVGEAEEDEPGSRIPGPGSRKRQFLAMELLEGSTLRERMAEGPVGPRRAIEYALQVARGLAAAHDRNIAHRDLKPENVFVTRDGHVKILDFGLAKAFDAGSAGSAGPAASDAGHSATRFATDAGTIVGTAGYMAPEQVRGQAVDHRTDIFAFGVLLYEMLSGTRPFSGPTPADTMSAVLTSEPPAFDTLQPAVSPALDRIVRRCLEKEPALRFQSARDLAFAIETLSAVQTSSGAALPALAAPRRWGSFFIVVGTLAALAAGLAAGLWIGGRSGQEPATDRPTAVFSFDAGFTFPPLVSLAPDGRTIAYNSPVPSSGATGVLWLRRLDGSEVPPGFPTALGEIPLAWSPDSRRLLVYGQGKLVAIDTSTGARETLASVPGTPRGAAWLPDGSVLGGAPAGIVRIPAGGGAPVEVLKADAARREVFAWPQTLTNGTRILYAAFSPDRDTEWRLGPIDGKGDRAADPVLLKGASGATVTEPDVVVYVRGTTLFAQRFDLARAVATGEPVKLATEVYESVGNGRASVGVSSAGVLVFRKEQFPSQILYWVDRSGRRLGEFPKRDQFSNFDLAPSGDRISVTVRLRPFSLGSQLWLLDVVRGVATNVSTPDHTYSDSLWSPDGMRLAFRIGGPDGNRVVVRPADGGADTTILERVAYPESWSPDGRHIALGVPVDDDYQLWTVDLGDGNKTAPLVTGATGLDEPKFSPDGKWVAYNGSEGGQKPEIYVLPFPPTGQRYQLSSQGGAQPRWRRDGRELFYLAPDGSVMSVLIPGGDVRQAAKPEPLFQTGLEVSPSFDQFVPSPDGQRFLIRRPEGATGDRAPVHVIVNWRALLDAPASK